MSPYQAARGIVGAPLGSCRARAVVAAILVATVAGAVLASLEPFARAEEGAAPHRADGPDEQAQFERWVAPRGACGGRTPCHASIQAAVDAAEAGETIRILPGAYTETVTAVDKPVMLVGPGGADAAFDAARHAVWSAPAGAALTVDARTRDIAGIVVSGLRFRSANVAIRLLGRRAGDPDGAPFGRPPSTADTAVRGARVVDNAFVGIGVGAAGPPVGPPPAALEARYAVDLATQGNLVRDGQSGFVLTGASGTLRDDRFERIALPAVQALVGSGELAMIGSVILSSGERGLDLGPLPSAVGAGGAARVAGARLEGGAGDGIHAERLRGTLVISGVVVTGMGRAGIRLVDISDARVRASSLVANGEGIRLVDTRPALAGAAGIVIGGSPVMGNDLGANLGASIARERGPETGAAADVDAKYNAWGAAWPEAIEDLIRDDADAPGLGRVRWRPPLGAPEAVTVSVSPAQVLAGGAEKAAVVARVVDAARMPVAGALVVLSADPAALDVPSATVEVEEDPAMSVGDWGLYRSQRFGPFRGVGYLQSDAPGAAIGWAFAGDALAVRLAHSPTRPGVMSAVVDGRLPVLIDTRDDAERWVEHLLARDLAAGNHHVTMTLVSGQLAVDALGAGPLTDQDGLVRTVLTPAADVGRGVVRAEAWGASGVRLGIVDVDYVPGPAAVITLTTAAPSIPVFTGRAPVTATVRDAVGRPVRDGTAVYFTTSLGVVTPMEATTRRGMALAELVAGTAAGTAHITATVGTDDAAREAATDVAIVPGPPAQLTLRTTPGQLTANSHDVARLEVTVSDTYDNAVADGTRVDLATSLGTIEVDGNPATHAPTRAGRVAAVLRSGAVAGAAEVSAAVGALAEAATVTLRAADLKVRKVVEPESALVPGEWVTYTVTYRNEGPGSVYDVLIEDPMPAELVSRVLSIDGPALGQQPGAAYRFVAARIGAGQEGSIQVRARVDTRLRWGARTAITNVVRVSAPSAAEREPVDNTASATILVIPMAVYSVTMSAPSALSVGGATGPVIVRVFDRDGRPAADETPVDLSADRGTIAPARVLTRGGVATATFTTGRNAGPATLRALSLDGRGAFARVTILPGPVAEVGIATDREWLPVGGMTATITASLSDQYGNRVAGAPVELASTLGALVRVQGVTDAVGEFTSTLRSGVRAGTARVTARSGTLSRSLTMPFAPGGPTRLSLTLGAGRGFVGVPLAARARVADEYDNPIAGQRVAFEATICALRDEQAHTDAAGSATVVLDCAEAGSGMVRARLGPLRAQAPLVVGARRAFIPFAQLPRGR